MSKPSNTNNPKASDMFISCMYDDVIELKRDI